MRAGPLVVALLAATAVAIYASPLTDVLVWKLGSRGDGLGRGEGLDLTVSGTGIPGSVEAWGTPAPASLTRRQEQLLEFREENAFKDNLALFWLPNEWRAAMPPYVQSWLRNWIMVAILYYVLGGVWVYYTYYAFGSQLFKPGEIPSLGAQLEQMKVWCRFSGSLGVPPACRQRISRVDFSRRLAHNAFPVKSLVLAASATPGLRSCCTMLHLLKIL